MKFLAALIAALIVLYFPAAIAALLGTVGALAVTASAQPACWAFVAGVLAANRHRTAPKAGRA